MSLARLARDAARRLRDADLVHVVSDNDADGIAAAAIVTTALQRAGIPFHVRCSGRPDDDQWRELERAEHILFMDMGSGQIDRIEQLPGHATILDHHTPKRAARTSTQVNPNLEGEDGTKNCCAATLAYLFAVGLDEDNDDLGTIALAGIIGDRQHVPGPRGENRKLLRKLVDAGHVVVGHGLSYDPDQPLVEALASGTDPYLVGIAGRARKAQEFLDSIGIDAETTINELDDEAHERLCSAIVLHLLSNGTRPDEAKEALRERWRLTTPVEVEAGTLTALLNACGRLQEAGVGVAAAAGDDTHLARAYEHLHAYDERVLKGLMHLEREPPERVGHIQVFDAPDEELAGTHCGMGLAFIFDKDVPVLAFAEYEEATKVSGRTTMELVGAGVDLSEALNVAAEEAGGTGGGHPVASGARIPKGTRESFIKRVDEIVGRQLGPEGPP